MDIPKDCKDNDTLYCPICGTSYLSRLQDVRKNMQFDIPTDQEHKPEPAIASFTSADYCRQVAVKREPELPPSFKVMQDKGIRFTSVDIRDGANRPLKRNREEDEYYY